MQAFDKKPRVIYLMGGLGNVLFQINLAFNMRDAGYKVRLNVYALTKNNIISKILRWSNHNALGNIIELGILNDFDIDYKFRFSFISALVSKKTKKTIFRSRFYGINTPLYSKIGNINNLFGYFQNDNPVNDLFVKHLREKLDAWLSLKNNLKESINTIVKRDEVVVHVRGGDFTVDPNLELSWEYYKRAIVVARSNCRSVLVVTNDALYVESILGDFSFQIISQDSPVADFIIIMKSHIKVLANSTFSWWAAELGDDSSRIVEVDSYYLKSNWLPLSKKQRIRVSRTIN
jgi:hypothetical protein